MSDISKHNDYRKHFESFSDANLEVFLNSGHTNVAMITAATEEVHKRRRAESESRNSREEENSSTSRKSLRLSIWAVIIALIAIAVSIKEQIFALIFPL
jgi:hypothetical protein